ncbi:MAG TPA: PHP domain-containing protein [Actinomycetota bacterium]|nr:PHP domain-containing protein [Actinomycetota bacterium]
MLTNAIIAELLALDAEAEEGHRERALRRASRAALTWPEEAGAVIGQDRPLTELRAVGPWVARRIHGWLEAPPDPPEPPVLRRGFITVAQAREVLADHPDVRLRADLQMHTTWSDGSASVREMVDACAALGYEHVAITDHSKGLPIARGMDEGRVAAQAEEVARVNAELDVEGAPIRALHAIEMNLSPSGDGDMELDALARLDLVLGAFHSRLRVTDDETDRYVRALRNPTVHVMAHPRGRKWNLREGLSADWSRVADEAAAQHTALEIDGYPDRQDADLELLAEIKRAGGYISIGTDAHATWELAFWELGLALALLAEIPRERILNLMTADELGRWVRERAT